MTDLRMAKQFASLMVLNWLDIFILIFAFLIACLEELLSGGTLG